jgi:peptidoglycan hydrolase-like protein with peptidoglycan-binding domain
MTRLAALLAFVVALAPGTVEATGRGDRGPDVVEIQTILHDFGYSVTVDGVYGRQTERAVRSWQRSNGLVVDGVAGQVTTSSLRQAVRVGNAHTVGAPADPSSAIEHYDIWVRLAVCESGGNWSINTGNSYYGGLQFSLTSWRAVGGSGYPHQASMLEQMARAERLLDIQGWGAWPSCSRQLGLR